MAQAIEYDVFISYAWRDGSDYAQQLETSLNKSGYSVWRDERGIEPSASFTAEIEKAIEASKVVVVCMTDDIAREDSFVRLEISYALAKKKPILPARFSPVSIIRLIEHTFADFLGKSWEQGIASLREFIDRYRNGDYQAPKLPQSQQDDPYYDFAQNALLDAVNLIKQTTIFDKTIELQSITTLEQVGKHKPKSSLKRAYRRMGVDEEESDISSLNEAMEKFGGQVLLLGEPGAGKTTSLLTLTRELASARMSNPNEPLPIFAFCSGWKASPPQPIYEWLGEENDIPVDEMERMISAGEVVLLLDGLDELGSSQTEKQKRDDETIEITFDPRKRFIETIPADGKIVVSTRIEDYEKIGDKLTVLKGAITLQNLTNEQLSNYLIEMPALWDVLKSDSGLLEIARTPLLLSLIAFGFRDAPENAQSLKDLKSHELRNAIFQTYIDRRYEHELLRLDAMGEKPPFTLEEIYEVLGHVAMINASGGRRKLLNGRDNWLMIHDNVLLEYDFDEKLTVEKIQSFIQYCIHLNLLVEVERELRFIHLRLRDMLVSHYCTLKRVLDENLYTKTYEPNPAKALGNLPNQEGLIFCLDLLNADVKSEMRVSAVVSLGRIGGEQALSVLIDILQHDKDSDVRSSATVALGRIGGEQVVSVLIDILQHDESLDVRRSVARALERIGGEQVVSVLIDILQYDEISMIRRSVADILGRIGGEQALSALITILHHDGATSVRQSVVMGLGQIGGKQALSALMYALQHDESSRVRRSIIEVLERIGGEQVVSALTDILQHDEVSKVRQSAADVLGHIGDTQVISVLIDILQHDEDEDVRWSVARALERIGGEQVVSVLIDLLQQNKDLKVRRSTVGILRQIGGEEVISVNTFAN